MIFGHPTDETLFLFFDGELSSDESDNVRTHLEDCASCRDVIAEFEEIAAMTRDPETWKLLDAASSFTADPERARDFGVRARQKEVETREAVTALRELLGRPVDVWGAWLHVRTQFHTAWMVTTLLAEARNRVQAQPRESLHIVGIATDIAQMLTDHIDRPVRLGLAANELATVLRFLGRNEEALAAVEEAAAILDPVRSAYDEKARVAWNRASVLFALERYRDARAALAEPKRWFKSIGDEVELVRIAIFEGSILHDEGDRAGALAIFSRAAQILETQPEQPDLAVVYANMAFCHLGLGNLSVARTYGEKAMSTYAHVDMLSERIRTRWMFAQLLIESGSVEEGLTDLRAAAMEYEAAGMVADAAQVDLERVEVLLRTDRWEEAAPIARQLVNVYERTGQRLSYVQALAYLREAVEAATATPELARYVRGYLGNQAEPPFRPPATPLPS